MAGGAGVAVGFRRINDVTPASSFADAKLASGTVNVGGGIIGR